jgi:hypothetical protein
LSCYETWCGWMIGWPKMRTEWWRLAVFNSTSDNHAKRRHCFTHITIEL